MESYGAGCQICETTTRPLLCANCANRGLLKERWAALSRVQQRRDAALARLEQLLADKKEVLAQQEVRQQLRQDKAAARQRANEAEKHRLAVQAKARKLQKHNTEHKEQLDVARLQLGRWQSPRELAAHMQEATKEHARQLHALLDEQSRTLRLRVHALLEMLPLDITALREGTSGSGPLFRQPSGPSGQQTPCVTIRGLRLPDTTTPKPETDAEARNLGTALGYVVLLTRVLAHYLNAPLLHCLLYQGSTSSIAPLPDAWDPLIGNDKPTSILGVLYTTVTASIAAPVQGFGASEKGGTSTGDDSPHASSLLSPTKVASTQSIPVGLYALARSMGALLSHAQALAGARLPDWHPFACLAAMCAQLKADPRRERRAARGPTGLPSSMLLRSSVFAGSSMQASALHAFLPDGAGEDEDDWDMVQRPAGWGTPGGLAASMSASLVGHLHTLPPNGAHGARVSLPLLPPTPCQADDVQHWERAMFTDSTSRAATSRAASGPLRPASSRAASGTAAGAAAGPAAKVASAPASVGPSTTGSLGGMLSIPGTAGMLSIPGAGAITHLNSAALERGIAAAANMMSTPASFLPFRRTSQQ